MSSVLSPAWEALLPPRTIESVSRFGMAVATAKTRAMMATTLPPRRLRTAHATVNNSNGTKVQRVPKVKPHKMPLLNA